MQPVRKASVRRWLDWELPGMMRQKALSAICSTSERCCCVAKRFISNSRSVHLTCAGRTRSQTDGIRLGGVLPPHPRCEGAAGEEGLAAADMAGQLP